MGFRVMSVIRNQTPVIVLDEDRHDNRREPKSRCLGYEASFPVINFVQPNSFEQSNAFERDLALLAIKRWAAASC